VPDWISLKQTLQQQGFDPKDLTNEELCENPYVIKLIQTEVSELTRELSEYERVRKVYLLPREFSIDKGEITPTLKIKRSVIDEKYAEVIDEICGSR
jgi:long-chain acyl-CoA synthetase